MIFYWNNITEISGLWFHPILASQIYLILEVYCSKWVKLMRPHFCRCAPGNGDWIRTKNSVNCIPRLPGKQSPILSFGAGWIGPFSIVRDLAAGYIIPYFCGPAGANYSYFGDKLVKIYSKLGIRAMCACAFPFQTWNLCQKQNLWHRLSIYFVIMPQKVYSG